MDACIPCIAAGRFRGAFYNLRQTKIYQTRLELVIGAEYRYINGLLRYILYQDNGADQIAVSASLFLRRFPVSCRGS